MKKELSIINSCCEKPVTFDKIECQPNPFKPTDKQIKRYQAEYNYINQLKILIESVSEFLQSKSYIKL